MPAFETVPMVKSRPIKNQSERSDLPCHIITLVIYLVFVIKNIFLWYCATSTEIKTKNSISCCLLMIFKRVVTAFFRRQKSFIVVSETRVLYFQMLRDIPGREGEFYCKLTSLTEINLSRIWNSLPVYAFKRAVISLLLLREEKRKYCYRKKVLEISSESRAQIPPYHYLFWSNLFG